MSEQRTVSDLVFRDLAPEPAATALDRDEEWEALVREELEKLRPTRQGPRVIPATSAAKERLEEPAH